MNTVKRVFEIIEYVLKNPDGVTASDVAEEFKMSLANAYKYLSVLENIGVLIKHKDRKYSGGFKLVEYGYSILRSFDIRRTARPFLIDLLMKTEQTVHMIIKEGFEGVYIEKLEGPRSLPMVSKIGMKVPLYCTALGKSILAHLPKEELEDYLKNVNLVKRTDNTITDPDKLRKELQKIRSLGYALDNEENELGVKCIGAPILNHEGYPIAALSISGVARRIDEGFEIFVDQVVSCARKISRRLGYGRGVEEDERNSQGYRG